MGSVGDGIPTGSGTPFDRGRVTLADGGPVGYRVAVDHKPDVSRAVEAAQELGDEELRQVLEILSGELKHRYKQTDRIAAAALKDTNWVETTIAAKKLPLGTKGHIVEIRREHVVVHFPALEGMFTVSAKMLRRIEPPAGGCPNPSGGLTKQGHRKARAAGDADSARISQEETGRPSRLLYTCPGNRQARWLSSRGRSARSRGGSSRST